MRQKFSYMSNNARSLRACQPEDRLVEECKTRMGDETAFRGGREDRWIRSHVKCLYGAVGSFFIGQKDMWYSSAQGPTSLTNCTPDFLRVAANLRSTTFSHTTDNRYQQARRGNRHKKHHSASLPANNPTLPLPPPPRPRKAKPHLPQTAKAAAHTHLTPRTTTAAATTKPHHPPHHPPASQPASQPADR